MYFGWFSLLTQYMSGALYTHVVLSEIFSEHWWFLSSFVKIQSDYCSPEIYRPENVTYWHVSPLNFLSSFICFFFYDVITTFSLYASTGTYFHFKLLKLLVRIEAIKMTKTGRFKAHLQSQASKRMCHIQTLGTCPQIEWNIKITAQNAKEINSTGNTKEGTDGQAYRRLNWLQCWFLKTC